MAQILIFGYGRVGSTIANNLDFAKSNILIVDYDDKALLRAQNDGFKTFKSSLAQDDDLIQAGVGVTVKYLYCVSGNDDLNIFVTLSARFIDQSIQIMARAEDANAKAKLLLAGANDTIDFNAIAAHKMSELLLSPLVYKLLDGVFYKQNEIYTKYHIVMEEILIPQNSPFINKTTISLDLKHQYDLILIGTYNKITGFEYSIDKANKTIYENDVLVVMGTEENIKKLVNEI